MHGKEPFIARIQNLGYQIDNTLLWPASRNLRVRVENVSFGDPTIKILCRKCPIGFETFACEVFWCNVLFGEGASIIEVLSSKKLHSGIQFQNKGIYVKIRVILGKGGPLRGPNP